MKNNFLWKLKNRVKQYGFFHIVKKHLFLKLVSPFYKLVKSNLVLVIPNHQEFDLNTTKVLDVNKNDLESYLFEGIFDKDFYKFCAKFIDTGSRCYLIIEKKQLAAWGFVQNEGVYNFGNKTYRIPKNVEILKNLYVKPEFRGKSFGKLINRVRINSIAENKIPCVFVIPENRYAIRNLEMFGFQKLLKVSYVMWFKIIESKKLRVFINDDKFNDIIESFNEI